MSKQDPKHVLSVEGLVAHRDKQPYIKILKDRSPVAQLSMAEARNFAMDILQMCARTEADAMIHRFFSDNQFPQGANDAIMLDFRKFRLWLDQEEVEKTVSTPSEDPPVN